MILYTLTEAVSGFTASEIIHIVKHMFVNYFIWCDSLRAGNEEEDNPGVLEHNGLTSSLYVSEEYFGTLSKLVCCHRFVHV